MLIKSKENWGTIIKHRRQMSLQRLAVLYLEHIYVCHEVDFYVYMY